MTRTVGSQEDARATDAHEALGEVWPCQVAQAIGLCRTDG